MLGDFIAYAFFGLIVGALARFALPGRRSMGCLTTIIAGLIVRVITGNDSYAPGWIASILGAMLVVWLYSRSQRGRQYY